MWSSTSKPQPIVTDLRASQDGVRLMMDEERRILTERVASLPATHLEIAGAAARASSDGIIALYQGRLDKLAKQIARRLGDQQYHVIIKHVGDHDHPFREAEIRAEERAVINAATVAARQRVLQAYGVEGITAGRIDAEMAADVEYVRRRSEITRKWLLEGLAGGQSEYRRLYELGGGGLLTEAAAEVQAWQRVGVDQGEG